MPQHTFTTIRRSGTCVGVHSDPVDALLYFPFRTSHIQCSSKEAVEMLLNTALRLKWPYIICEKLGAGFEYVGFSYDSKHRVTIERRPATYPWRTRTQLKAGRMRVAA